jgi:hypothetical protein
MASIDEGASDGREGITTAASPASAASMSVGGMNRSSAQRKARARDSGPRREARTRPMLIIASNSRARSSPRSSSNSNGTWDMVPAGVQIPRHPAHDDYALHCQAVKHVRSLTGPRVVSWSGTAAFEKCNSHNGDTIGHPGREKVRGNGRSCRIFVDGGVPVGRGLSRRLF